MSRRAAPTWAVAWLCAAAGYLLVANYPYSADSFVYAAAAESLSDSGQWLLPFGSSAASHLPVPYAAWAPGYPVLIAAVSLGWDNPWLAARVLSGLGVTLALVIWGWNWRLRNWPRYLIVFPFVSSTTALVLTTAWSEGPFIACALGAWASLSRWSEKSGPRAGYLLGAVLLLGAGTLFRYAGTFLVVPVLWIIWKRGTRSERLIGIACTCAALAPLGLWLTRNFATTSLWRGARVAPPALWRAPAELCMAAGDLLCTPWVLQPQVEAFLGGLLLFALGLLLVRFRRNLPARPEVQAALWFGIALALGTTLARGLGQGGNVSARLLWPALPFLAIALAVRPANVSGRLARVGTAAILIYATLQTAGVLTNADQNPRWEREQEAMTLPDWGTDHRPVLANRPWTIWKRTGGLLYGIPNSAHETHLLHPDTLGRWAASHGVRHLYWQNEERTPSELRQMYGPLADMILDPDTSKVRLRWSSPRLSVFEIAREY